MSDVRTVSLESAASVAEWAQFLAAVLTDTIPATCDVIGVFAQNDLQLEILDVVVGLARRFARQPQILINGLDRYEPTERSWGCGAWLRFLIGNYGVRPEQVTVLPEARHTGQEAEEIIRFSARHGWKTITIVATPYRMPRCFLTTLGVMRAQGLALKIFCRSISAIDWGGRAEKHSVIAGSVVGTRFDQLAVELEKIVEYREKFVKGVPDSSPIASIEEGLQHLRARSEQ